MIRANQNKIKCVYVGWGDMSIGFTTDPNSADITGDDPVDEIREEMKTIGCGEYGTLKRTVYRGYVNGRMTCEVEAGTGVTLIFEEFNELHN